MSHGPIFELIGNREFWENSCAFLYFKPYLIIYVIFMSYYFWNIVLSKPVRKIAYKKIYKVLLTVEGERMRNFIILAINIFYKSFLFFYFFAWKIVWV